MAPVSTVSMSTPGTRARAARGSSEDGIATATGLLLSLLVLIMFVFLAMSVAMYFFELANLRAAVNEAVRAGEPFGLGEAECNDRFDELRDSLGLIQGLTDSDEVCTLDTDRDQLVASAEGTFSFWTPFPLAEVDVSASARAMKDHGR